jgi:acyl dehydratase
MLQLKHNILQEESRLMRYFEDFQVGEQIELGSVTVTEEEMIAFARQFDPQPFHISLEQAKHSFYGGLIASGWHTVSVLMRLMVDALINDTLSLGSPGVDEVRWLKPVRPNDTLHARLTIVDAVPSKRRAELGILTSSSEVFNQSGELVLTLKGVHFFGRRPSQHGKTHDGAETE